ncbi:hypothetical protein [Schumannella soli]|uniref:Uncharacterized protein n=1 Tax=Schumannella soli TaxID=2590779 RepID=A0A506XYK0_9MICO|nr:hypothetical protein [Schumannella soli]TPW74875.1 hypothetical protein FJ657_15015 [Schumannella soli]
MRQSRAATPLDELTAAAFRRDATAADVEALRAAFEAQRRDPATAGRPPSEAEIDADIDAELVPSRRMRIGGPFWLGMLGGAGAAALVAIAFVTLAPRSGPVDSGDPSGASSASANSDAENSAVRDAGSPSPGSSTRGGHADDPAVVRLDGVGSSVDVDPTTGRIVAEVGNDWSLIGSSQPDPQRGAAAPAWRLWMTTTASGGDCYMAVELAVGQATTAATRCGRPLVGVDVAELRLPSYRIAVRSDGISIEET